MIEEIIMVDDVIFYIEFPANQNQEFSVKDVYEEIEV